VGATLWQRLGGSRSCSDAEDGGHVLGHVLRDAARLRCAHRSGLWGHLVVTRESTDKDNIGACARGVCEDGGHVLGLYGQRAH
jgi:hypothetical protein